MVNSYFFAFLLATKLNKPPSPARPTTGKMNLPAEAPVLTASFLSATLAFAL